MGTQSKVLHEILINDFEIKPGISFDIKMHVTLPHFSGCKLQSFHLMVVPAPSQSNVPIIHSSSLTTSSWSGLAGLVYAILRKQNLKLFFGRETLKLMLL